MSENNVIDCVSFLLIKDNRVLVEKRKMDKRIDPGTVCLPGGKIERGETPEIAVRREALEETGITLAGIEFVCRLTHASTETLSISYFACENWSGEIFAYEAEKLFWVSLESDAFDFDVDAQAVKSWRDMQLE